jgi:hypothetical protein
MLAFAEDLYNGALEAHKALWPGQATPSDPSDLGNDLQLSNVCVGEWQDSGAQVGADEALTYFMSWYEKVDLETLRSVREGSMWTIDPELIRRCQELAHSYVDIYELAKDADAEDAKGSDSSQDEEETEDGGNARTDAPTEQSAPTDGGASVPSNGSGTHDADISTATAPSAGGSASAPAS